MVNLIQQQSGNFREARLGITHGRCTIAIATAEVALPVNEGVALAEVLRHAHQGVVGGLVAVRVKTAQNIADHSSALDGLGACCARETQAHAGHGIKNTSLNRFLAIAHIGQRAAFYNAQSIFKVGTLRVGGQIQGVIRLAVLKV